MTNRRSEAARQARWDRREERVYDMESNDFFGSRFSDDRNTHVQGAKANYPKLEQLASVYGSGGLDRRKVRKELCVLIRDIANDEELGDFIEKILIQHGIKFTRPDKPTKPKRNIDLD